MGLYDRLLDKGLTDPRGNIPVHQFCATLSEILKGKMTEAEMALFLGLDAGEQTELATLVPKLYDPLDSISLGGHTVLTNIGSTFDGTAWGLGWVRLQVAGIDAYEFSVKINKIGSGTQHWQLWNETDGVEIALISDAGATGIKTLTTGVTTLASPLAPGMKDIRVRARSTTAADDPVYFGASLVFRRVERLTAADLWFILLHAVYPNSLYSTVALLKSRLGVP